MDRSKALFLGFQESPLSCETDLGTYIDSGKSGLSLKGRDGLKRLLSDAVSGAAGYDAILVLDVSRWGRFQDVDQGSHYEWLCRSAGVPVHYVAEPF